MNPSIRKRLIAIMLLSLFVFVQCGDGKDEIRRPGRQADGSILLPNHWKLTPAGEQIDVGDLPLAAVVSPDGRYLLVTNNGYTDHYVSVIDIAARREINKIPIDRSWLGLTFNRAGDTIYISGAASDFVEAYSFRGSQAEHEATYMLKPADDERPFFAAGLAVSDDSRLLVTAALRRNLVVKTDLRSGRRTFIEVGEWPYTVIIHPDNKTAYVSNWGGKSISVVDLVENRETGRIQCGSHPNAMLLSPDASRLYVTNANSNDVSIISTAEKKVVETIDLTPYEGAPGGTTPNGMALSSDGKTLYVVNADNNDVAMVNVSASPAVVNGLIPTGWYPTAAALSKDDETLFITNGKGLGSKPNPKGPQPTEERTPATEYIGMLFPGTVSVIDVPNGSTLKQYTSQVNENNGFEGMEEKLAFGVVDMAPRAIPRRIGERSFINYVFYIIKENRTYDQVFGDLPQGEGDSTLTLFGRDVTPNHHKLAETFVLFDNFYVDAEVSADGHEWSMGAIATDFVEKLWPTNYSGRNFPFPAEGAFEIAYPDAGYLWDAAARADITYRSYGEFTRAAETSPTLKGHIAPDYPGYNLTITDVRRAEEFIKEFKQFVDEAAVPRLNVIRLPNDHTAGTRPGYPTPRAMAADNDLALGMIVETISHSSIWNESAIFIVEDDSQNGPDHIDAHRTVALVASPYAKRGYVDHIMYDTVSMLKTIELILGLQPMSQYDAAAIPMFTAFDDIADFAPYDALPNTYPLDEMNTADSYGAELSMQMNLEELDAAPEELLNEIIWKSIRGADSEMPRPHTIRVWIDLDDDDDEEEKDKKGEK